MATSDSISAKRLGLLRATASPTAREDFASLDKDLPHGAGMRLAGTSEGAGTMRRAAFRAFVTYSNYYKKIKYINDRSGVPVSRFAFDVISGRSMEMETAAHSAAILAMLSS